MKIDNTQTIIMLDNLLSFIVKSEAYFPMLSDNDKKYIISKITDEIDNEETSSKLLEQVLEYLDTL